MSAAQTRMSVLGATAEAEARDGQLTARVGAGAVAPKAAVKLRLDLNLEVEIAIQAKVNGDITLSLLALISVFGWISVG
ncbi:hypothetical protein EV421DRAFT_1903388 [Armillaria borealis]|uniref:Uncharacterized protein n=1 Tax=Armillaria borealis TaxID=47425 RepID=A0AA39JJ92_9AGAR|nr:hypothetical protein EV421DRAFT_1903388 [Armillaria borealis]